MVYGTCMDKIRTLTDRTARRRESERAFVPTTHCPRCGRKLHKRRDGMFQWNYCPAVKACGWDVFA